MIDIYCDAGSLDDIERYAADQRISGFTTNPALMKKYGIRNYKEFAAKVLALVGNKPVSFEVLADDWPTMDAQAREIASWGENVYVKIPVTNCAGESSAHLINALSSLRLNITAVMTPQQMRDLSMVTKPHHIISIFAGRIADTGIAPTLSRMIYIAPARTLWASSRAVFDVYQAEEYGYDIITLTPELIAKLELRGKSLTEYSRETVAMFHEAGKGIEL